MPYAFLYSIYTPYRIMFICIYVSILFLITITPMLLKIYIFVFEVYDYRYTVCSIHLYYNNGRTLQNSKMQYCLLLYHLSVILYATKTVYMFNNHYKILSRKYIVEIIEYIVILVVWV